MSKKHFIALADSLSEIRRRAKSVHTTGEVMRIVEDELCRFCRHQNGNFDASRFIEYSLGKCWPSGGKLKPSNH